MTSPQHRIKVSIVGDGGVGKTTYARRFATGIFEKKYIGTLGVDVCPLFFNTNHGSLLIDVWDVAGQEKFSYMKEGYIKGSDGVIGMFDVGNRITYNNMKKWKSDVLKAAPNAHLLACGNKIDLLGNPDFKSKVSFNDKETLRKEWGYYYDISAKSNYNFEKPFLEIARSVLNLPDLVFTIKEPVLPPEVKEGLLVRWADNDGYYYISAQSKSLIDEVLADMCKRGDCKSFEWQSHDPSKEVGDFNSDLVFSFFGINC